MVDLVDLDRLETRTDEFIEVFSGWMDLEEGEEARTLARADRAVFLEIKAAQEVGEGVDPESSTGFTGPGKMALYKPGAFRREPDEFTRGLSAKSENIAKHELHVVNAAGWWLAMATTAAGMAREEREELRGEATFLQETVDAAQGDVDRLSGGDGDGGAALQAAEAALVDANADMRAAVRAAKSRMIDRKAMGEAMWRVGQDVLRARMTFYQLVVEEDLVYARQIMDMRAATLRTYQDKPTQMLVRETAKRTATERAKAVARRQTEREMAGGSQGQTKAPGPPARE